MSKKTKQQAKKPVKSGLNQSQQALIAIGIIILLALAWFAYSKMSTPAQSAVEPTKVSAAQEAPAPSDTTSNSAAQSQPKQYSAVPPMTIDPKKQYFADFKMAKGGDFVVQLYPDKAPITVNSFVFLARDGFFNGVTFHRVLEGFMAQGGDPTGSGMGGPGYEFVNEDSDLKFDKPGVLAMANAGRDTNGSQFFITFGPTEQLNGGYTIFGQVTSGMDVVNGITRRDPDQNPTFTGDVIESITITEK
ncbi:MAG: peptidylprolyl isomerase [Chloroflexota bacterium]